MKVLISHPTGNQNVRAAAMGFVELGIPISFHTTIATFSGDVFDRLSELNAFSALSRRRYDDRIRNFTITSPWREMGRLISSRFGLYNLTRGERGVFSIDSVYRSLDKRVATTLTTRNGSATDAVYCYEDGALFSFRKAKELGIRCFYDLPIGYWRAGRSMMQEEKER
ncbi:MAG TPA: glycosyl transferase family 1, partial [Chryseosolibacter sp.]|nr:glycosyl transferase family 1 [Chryseosolibacter sp.]